MVFSASPDTSVCILSALGRVPSFEKWKIFQRIPQTLTAKLLASERFSAEALQRHNKQGSSCVLLVDAVLINDDDFNHYAGVANDHAFAFMHALPASNRWLAKKPAAIAL